MILMDARWLHKNSAHFDTNTEDELRAAIGPYDSSIAAAGEYIKGSSWVIHEGYFYRLSTDAELTEAVGVASVVDQTVSPVRPDPDTNKHLLNWVIEEFDDGFINASDYGADPTGVEDAYTPWRNAMIAAGTGGTWRIEPGTYHLSQPFELVYEDQTILAEGVKFNNTIANVNRGNKIIGRITGTAENSVEVGGPWHYYITRFGQNAALDLFVEDVDGVAFTAGGFDGVSGVAEYSSLTVRAEDVGIGQAFSVGTNGLLSYVRAQVAGTTTIGSITSGGTGYRDGRYICPTTTLSGSGSGAIVGIRVSGGVIAECVPLIGGSGYSTGDTITLGASGDCRSREWHDESLFVKQTMNPAVDALWAEYRTLILANSPSVNSPDSYSAPVVAKRAELMAIYDDLVGSGFVFTVGNVSNTGWFNSNRSVNFGTLIASYAGSIGDGLQNYNKISLYAEAIHSGREPHVRLSGVSSSFDILNVLSNSSFQTDLPDTQMVDFSGQFGVVINGGRVGSQYISSAQDPDWINTIINSGAESNIEVQEVFAADNNTRGESRHNGILVDSIRFKDDPATLHRSIPNPEEPVTPTDGLATIPPNVISSAINQLGVKTEGHVVTIPFGQLTGAYSTVEVVIHLRRTLGNSVATSHQGVIHLTASITNPATTANANVIYTAQGAGAYVDENASGLDAAGNFVLVIDTDNRVEAMLIAGRYFTASANAMDTAVASIAQTQAEIDARTLRKYNGVYQLDTQGLDRTVDAAAYATLVSAIPVTVQDALAAKTLTAYGLAADGNGHTSDLWKAVSTGATTAEWFLV